ncbi:hypothetical protein HYPSUDRAFT_201400 [Hypholoma sublateritium FD-334 SS-4]|uniref:Uncharacterized protein n=1 Tax=Hypholoma sublateritium (strain FD-334 SS-4) TaxID=945553 RepID=A0A0D2P3U8_HYPSF|nr:hypothetical protein HYPSUDRAFT_201400 [Hypholoma sublateritium FD-334 SS-4]
MFFGGALLSGIPDDRRTHQRRCMTSPSPTYNWRCEQHAGGGVLYEVCHVRHMGAPARVLNDGRATAPLAQHMATTTSGNTQTTRRWARSSDNDAAQHSRYDDHKPCKQTARRAEGRLCAGGTCISVKQGQPACGHQGGVVHITGVTDDTVVC